MKVVIPAAQRPILKTIIDYIDTSYADSSVCFIINKMDKTLVVISGQAPTFAQCTIFLDAKSPHIKDTQFSLDGGFCKQLLNYTRSNDLDIELDIEMSGSRAKVVETIDTSARYRNSRGHAGIRRCKSKPTKKEHLTYLNSNKIRPMVPTTKATVQSILHEASAYSGRS